MASEGVNDVLPFAPRVFVIDGPLVRDTGAWFTIRMTVVKLSDGSLWVDSTVPTSFDTLERIAELGQVKYLVAATPRHVAPRGVAHPVPRSPVVDITPYPADFLKDLSATRILGNAPETGWAEDLDQLSFKGNPAGEEVIFFHRQARTVIPDDLIQSDPLTKGRRISNAIFKIGEWRLPGQESPGDEAVVHPQKTRQTVARSVAVVGLREADYCTRPLRHGRCKGLR